MSKHKRSKQVLKVAVAGTLSLALLHGPIVPGVSAATAAVVTEVDTVVTTGSGTTAAQTSASQGQKPDPNAVKFSKEEAEKRVRELFPMLQDAELQNITLGDPNSFPQTNELIWTLDWNVSKGNSSWGFSMKVDALNGDIRSYYYPSYSEEESIGYPPALNREAASDIAKAFVLKAAPSLKNAELKDSWRTYSSPSMSSLFAPVSYSFDYQVVMNGVPSEVEYISLVVDGKGEIRQFHYQGPQGEYPSAIAEVSQEEALAAIREQIVLEPVYLNSNQNYYPGNRQQSDWTIGYVAVGGSQMIDAKEKGVLDGPTLSDGEMQSLPESKDVFKPHQGALMTEEQAIARVEQVYSIPEGYIQQQGYLSPSSSKDDKQIWQLSWMKEPNPRGGMMDYIQVNVEAATGRITQFSDYGRLYSGQEVEEPTITEAEAQAEALRLIQLLYPDAASELMFSSPSEGSKSVYGTYNYNFSRYYGEYRVNSIGVHLTLDGNGHLSQYYDYSLTDAELTDKLDSLELKVSLEAAEQAYREALSADLVYTTMLGTSIQGLPQISDIQLAYVPFLKGQRTDGYIDGMTGELKLWTAGYAGTEAPEQQQAKDIEGHWAQEQLEAMMATGILAVDDEGLLAPNSEISLGDWMLMITKALYGEQAEYMSYGNKETWFADVKDDSPYVHAAELFVRQGWMKQDETAVLNPEQPLTRQRLAVLLTHMLNYDKLADYMKQDVSVSTLADAGTIQNKGAVAIVGSLGLLQPSNGRFNPEGVVTKAQAATIIMRLAALQGKTDSTLFR